MKTPNKKWALLALVAAPFLMGSTDPLDGTIEMYKLYCPSECDKSATFTCTNLACRTLTEGDYSGGSEKFVKDPSQQFYACKKSTVLIAQCRADIAACGEFYTYILPGCSGQPVAQRNGYQRGCN